MACGPGQSEGINRKRFIQASQGVNTCLPDDSGVQSISSGLLTTCTTGIQAAGVFALQTWKALCWLWSEIQETQASVAAIDVSGLEAEIAANTASIAALQAAAPPSHVGTPTLSASSAAGVGATAVLLAGSTDTEGGISITLGTAPTAAGGALCDLIFGTAFTAPIFPVMSVRPRTPGGLFVDPNPGNAAPFASITISVFSPSAVLAVGQVIQVYYRIGFTA